MTRDYKKISNYPVSFPRKRESIFFVTDSCFRRNDMKRDSFFAMTSLLLHWVITKIKAWQLVDKLALMVYEITANFPKSEIYGLTSQIRRAVVSVATNIVEGATRKSRNEYLQFLYTAFSSLSEVGYLCKFACKIGYIDSETSNRFELKYNEVAKTLRGLINYIERSHV